MGVFYHDHDLIEWHWNPQIWRQTVIGNVKSYGLEAEASFKDAAEAYDPRQSELPDDLDLPAEEREIGGLGLYLVLENSDGFNYERVGNRNRNIISMNRPVSDSTGKAIELIQQADEGLED